MKHAHIHTHDGEPPHNHFHGHEQAVPAISSRDHAEHAASPHEHEHRTRQVTVQLTFDVGTLDDIGLGGFKIGWVDAEQDGREYSLAAGAGCGSSLLEASVRGPDGQPSVYAMADIRTLVSALWPQMEAIQAELAAAAEQEA